MERQSLDPHAFEHAGLRYEVRFEHTADGWLGHIRRDGDAAVQVVAFPDGHGFAADDVRGSLVAACEATVAALDRPAPTRH